MRIFKLLIASIILYSCTAEDPFVDVSTKIVYFEVQKITKTSASLKGKFLSAQTSLPEITVYASGYKYELEPSNINFDNQTEGTFQTTILINAETSNPIYVRIVDSKSVYVTRTFYYNPYTNRLEGPY